MLVESKRKGASGPFVHKLIGLVVDIHPPQFSKSYGVRKGKKRRKGEVVEHVANSGIMFSCWGELVGTQLNMRNNVHFNLSNEQSKLVDEIYPKNNNVFLHQTPKLELCLW